MGNIRNSPVLEKTHRFLYSDTECIVKDFFRQFIECHSLWQNASVAIKPDSQALGMSV